MFFDEDTHEFKEIFPYAEVYLANKGERSAFTFEVGVVPPLYLVATRCLVPSIERKAIEMMKRAPRKESVLGSDSMSQFTERILVIEEEKLHDQPPIVPNSASNPNDISPPAALARTPGPEIVMNDSAGRFDARITRYSYDPITS